MLSSFVFDKLHPRPFRSLPILPPVLRTLFQVPYPVSPASATLTKTAGVGVFFPFRNVSDVRRSDPRMFQGVSELSPFFSHSCVLFCIRQNLNPFVFKRFCTLWPKTPGGGGLSFIPNTRRQSARLPTSDCPSA